MVFDVLELSLQRICKGSELYMDKGTQEVMKVSHNLHEQAIAEPF